MSCGEVVSTRRLGFVYMADAAATLLQVRATRNCLSLARTRIDSNLGKPVS